MGGDQDSEREKTADFDRGLYGLRQFESYDQCSPSGGAGVCVGGGWLESGWLIRRPAT